MRKRISRVMISGALSLSLCLSPVVSVMGEDVFVEDSTEAFDDAANSDSVVFSEEEGDVTASRGQYDIEEPFYSEEEGSSDEAYYSVDVYFSGEMYGTEELIDSDEGSAEEAWADDPVYEETGTEEENGSDGPSAFEEVVTDEESYAVYTIINEKEFITSVEKIPVEMTLSISHSANIVIARTLYEMLTDEQKKLSAVKAALKKLEAAEDALKKLVRQSITGAIQDLVDALPFVSSADTTSVIDKAQKAIEKLTGNQKLTFPELKTKLEEAEAKLKKAVENGEKEAAEKIKASIASLPSAFISDIKEKAEKVIKAYSDLAEDQKKLLGDDTTKKLDEIVAELEKLMQQKSLDKIAAGVVESLLSYLPDSKDVTEGNKEAVELAKAAFDALTDAQKALFPEAEKQINALLKQIEDKETAKALSDSIAKIPEAKAGEGKAAVQNAEKIRTGMTSDQLALVPEADLALLDRATEAYKEGRTFVIAGAKYQVLSNGNLTYAGPEDRAVSSVSVPNQIKKGGLMFKVEQISEAALKECENLKWVVIHKNIKTIGKDAFYNTPNLEIIKVMSKHFETGRVVSAFAEAGMNRGAGLIVKTPNGYESTYRKLFKGEGKLNEKAVVIAA